MDISADLRPLQPVYCGMQVQGIYQPGYQGPGFLGVPAPPGSPGLFRPNGSGNKDQGLKGKSQSYAFGNKGSNRMRFWSVSVPIGRVLLPQRIV